MKDGHLYGSLIDILRSGAPLILVGIGMTVVIATGGIDLSVGAVVAISGAVAVSQISKLGDQNSVAASCSALRRRARARHAAAACGTAYWSPCSASSRSSPR